VWDDMCLCCGLNRFNLFTLGYSLEGEDHVCSRCETACQQRLPIGPLDEWDCKAIMPSCEDSFWYMVAAWSRQPTYYPVREHASTDGLFPSIIRNRGSSWLESRAPNWYQAVLTNKSGEIR
jgi:hypothetical protein